MDRLPCHRANATRWLALFLLTTSLSCGTLFYPDRRGMEETGRVDPVVVLMDGVLLLAFVVPGVVAFGVDLATGAIYEPEGEAWAMRVDPSPVELTVADARSLALHPPASPASAHAREAEPGPVWWETGDGERIATRALPIEGDAEVEGGAEGAAGYRLEPEKTLEPGPHDLVLRGPGGAERRVALLLR